MAANNQRQNNRPVLSVVTTPQQSPHFPPLGGMQMAEINRGLGHCGVHDCLKYTADVGCGGQNLYCQARPCHLAASGQCQKSGACHESPMFHHEMRTCCMPIETHDPFSALSPVPLSQQTSHIAPPSAHPQSARPAQIEWVSNNYDRTDGINHDRPISNHQPPAYHIVETRGPVSAISAQSWNNTFLSASPITLSFRNWPGEHWIKSWVKFAGTDTHQWVYYCRGSEEASLHRDTIHYVSHNNTVQLHVEQLHGAQILSTTFVVNASEKTEVERRAAELKRQHALSAAADEAALEEMQAGMRL